MSPLFDSIWENATLATLSGASAHGAHGATAGHEGAGVPEVIPDGAIGVRDGRIAWLGPRRELPSAHGATVHDCEGAWLTPGLIDCHTHLVYAGNRAAEFERLLNGETYAQIAASGGGIRATVRATRAASAVQLERESVPRLRRLLSEGVTTVEIKSGYGLELETELRILRVARALGTAHGARVQTTFLGAHTVPDEFAGRTDHYLDEVCERMLPAAAAAGLADAVDAFCEGIAFTPEQTQRVFARARELGLPVKLHADQLTDCGGAALVARYGGLSADHVEYTSETSVRALAQSGTVAVLLPGAFYFLRETRVPPVELLREHRVPMAIATDCNPGTSPCTSILLMLNMACTLFRLTPAEALCGVTVHAARALGLQNEAGRLAVGLSADFALFQVAALAELAYAVGANPCVGRVLRGTPQDVGASEAADTTGSAHD